MGKNIEPKNSLTINLPCQVGKTVYFIDSECNPVKCVNNDIFCENTCEKYQTLSIHKTSIKQFVVTENQVVTAECKNVGLYENEFDINALGEKWFLTFSDAKEKLKKLKESGIVKPSQYYQYLEKTKSANFAL